MLTVEGEPYSYGNNNVLFPKKVNVFFFKRVIDVIKRNIIFFLTLSVITAGISYIITSFISKPLLGEIDLADIFQKGNSFKELLPVFSKMVFDNVVLLIPYSYFFTILISALPNMYLSKPASFFHFNKQDIVRMLILYVYLVIIFHLEIAGLLMCIIPGIIIIIWCSFIPLVIVIENNYKPVKRSFYLLSGRQLEIFFIYLVILFLQIIFSIPYIVLYILKGEEAFLALQKNALFTIIFESMNIFIIYGAVVLLFQIYMMARIANNEIEVVQE